MCMDGFEYVSRLLVSPQELQQLLRGSKSLEVGPKLLVVQFFGDACRRVGLPLDDGKELIGLFSAGILGGELDGVAGVFRHARDKTHVLLTGR